MPDRPQSIPPSPLIDLSRFNEATRRELYNLTVVVHFTAHDPDDPEEYVPPYSPDEAGLTVFWAFGRWWVVWRRLDVPEGQPERDYWELLRVEGESESSPWGYDFCEVGE
jgi:hypothetical protein